MYSERIRENGAKAIVLSLFYIVLSIYTLVAKAQTPETQGNYSGAAVSFQTRAFTLSSNIEALDGLHVIQEGGQAGLFFGNSKVRTHIGLVGLLYSSMQVPRTINVFEAEAGVNYYLLPGRTFEPYLTGGVVMDNLRFRGHYLNSEQVNMSEPEPYLGSITAVDATFGGGVEVGLLNTFQFVHLFTEIKYGVKVFGSASNAAFENTTVSDQLMVGLGLRFGILR
ncbi:MAG: hypothetical protein DIU61_007415 [Bacteroidota bacterium]|jgi:hypothetical protein|nr:MAG: hypothetical protein DIU61_02940 [Bacteroidota bacterium]